MAAKKLGTTKHAKTIKNIQPPKHIQQESQKPISPFTHTREKSKQRDRHLFLKAKRAAKEKNRTRREQPTILVGEKIVNMRKKQPFQDVQLTHESEVPKEVGMSEHRHVPNDELSAS